MADRFFWCPVCEEPHAAEGDLPASCPLGDAHVSRSDSHDTISETVAAPQRDVMQTGTLVDERYVVEGCVGEGGMGMVYRVRDLRMSRTIALKTVKGMFDEDSRAGKRFLREAQVMAALTHPGVVRVFDFGVIDTQVAYLAMELLTGMTLVIVELKKALLSICHAPPFNL